MNLEQLKKTLAKVGIASLIAGSALTFTGCAKQMGSSSVGDKTETTGQNSQSGSRSSAGGMGQRGGSSCGGSS